MKYVLLIGAAGLAGCQSSPAPSVLPAPTKVATVVTAPPAPPPAAVPASSLALEQKVRQQAQYIEALISQNEALAARLAASVKETPKVASPVVAAVPVAPPVPGKVELSDEAVLRPNADGVIDLVTALVSSKSGEPVNPFTVRTVPPELMREVTLLVGGVASGATPCAVINDRLALVGETVESLTVERVETDAVVARHSGRLLRLPVSEKPTRVRLPL